MDLVPVGDHIAKLADYGVSVTKNGDPMVTAKFQTSHGPVYWNGVIKDMAPGQRNFTMESLVVMGLKSVDDVAAIADGPAGKALNMEQDVSVAVEHEEYNGKVRAKARWVNALGLRSGVTRDDLRAKLAGLKNLRADFTAAYSGKKKDSSSVSQEAPLHIPF